MKITELIKLHVLKRLPAIIGAVLIAALFSLYYIGFIDFSFIERPDGWKENIDLFVEMIDNKKESNDKNENSAPETTPEEDKKEEDKDSSSPETDKTPETTPPDNNTDKTPSYQMPTFLSVSEMKEKGYRLTDKIYDESCVFAKLTPKYDWPKEFSYSWKSYDKEKVTYFDDGTETKVEPVRTSGERAALEMYMGYIIYDNDGEIFLIGPDGQVMLKYDDKEFIPAYTRDKEGRPLFYKYNTFTEKYPTVLGEEKENGDREWKKTAELKIKDKVYYYLAPNGQYFQKSDYNDATDNRGLYFDYPSYYGTSDSRLKRYYINTTKFFTTLKGETSVLDVMSWTYSKDKLKLADFKFDRDGVLITDKEPAKNEEPKTKKDLFPYTMAYNYSEKYATVFMDIEWTYDHDKENDGIKKVETYDAMTNELRVIDENGKIMFESRKNFFSDLSWTAHEKFSKPLLSGIDSIGSYYFDHGLMRMRVQSWDCYYFAEFDTVKIVTDEDILIRPNGQRFNLPTGYKLISYSDGILLLEKDGEYGYMNYLGNWIRDPELLDAGPFLEGVAVCKNTEGNYGVIDTEGKAVIPFTYKYISNISGGTMVAYSETGGWTVYQKLTK